MDVVHWELVEEHGGRHGIRDENAIESALARPRHISASSSLTPRRLTEDTTGLFRSPNQQVLGRSYRSRLGSTVLCR